MTLGIAVAAFFLIWWVTLLGVLPWGVRSQHEAGAMPPGTDPGAPTRFRFGRTLVRTTGVAIVIYVVCCVVYSEHWITLSGLMGHYDYTK